MKKFAVIGNPIAHSLSPVIHQYFARAKDLELSYEKILGSPEAFETEVRGFFAEEGSGLNITLPFKLRAYAMAEQKSLRATKAKAANVLLKTQDGHLFADNTDGIGLVRDLGQHLDLKGKKAIILGAGGAARGIIAPLLAAGLSSLALGARDGAKAQGLREEFPGLLTYAMADLGEQGPVDLIIHATSAAFSNSNTALELPDSIWKGSPFGYDLSYSREGNTPFVERAMAQGCQAVDGLGMLIEQAAEAFMLWHGVVIAKHEKKALLSYIATGDLRVL